MALLDVRASELALLSPRGRHRFEEQLARHRLPPLRRERLTTLQVNVGKRCNQACLHCHVEAGPNRTESMSDAVAERLVALLARSPSVGTVDITGGAPELHESFRYLLSESRALGREVIVRHNLTVQFEPGMGDLPELFRDHRVEVVASLPCYGSSNVDAQRGTGVFDKSVDALRRLNAVGFGLPDAGLVLTLVYNPGGASLPPSQARLEADYRRRLREDFGLEFTRLLTLTNMPIKRFAWDLTRSGRFEAYMQLLVEGFNPATVDGLMCRSLISVSWDGRLFDCDFNQMLDLPAGAVDATEARTIWDIDGFAALDAAPIATGAHCLGCTAGAGSSCGGALT